MYIFVTGECFHPQSFRSASMTIRLSDVMQCGLLRRLTSVVCQVNYLSKILDRLCSYYLLVALVKYVRTGFCFSFFISEDFFSLTWHHTKCPGRLFVFGYRFCATNLLICGFPAGGSHKTSIGGF